jgi:hypothetical protein
MRPFSCGTQFGDWEGANCCRCKKGAPDGSWATCPIQAALIEAYLGDGEISDEIADRMGRANGRYNWPCGEVEWTEEWKSEWLSRQAEPE